MDVVLGYFAGLLTLINPCVLPVLPIVLASSLHADRRAPMALAAGMSLSFVLLGITVSALGPALGVNSDSVARGAAVLMVFFGIVMLVPALSGRFSQATSGLAAQADARIDAQSGKGLRGQFISGILLGAVWSPCIGPTLGAAISLASTGESLFRATLTMVFFAAGVSTLILGLAYGAHSQMRRRQQSLRVLAERAKPIMGVAFVVIGFGLWFRVNHAIEAFMLSVMPVWLVDLSVSI